MVHERHRTLFVCLLFFFFIRWILLATEWEMTHNHSDKIYYTLVTSDTIREDIYILHNVLHSQTIFLVFGVLDPCICATHIHIT